MLCCVLQCVNIVSTSSSPVSSLHHKTSINIQLTTSSNDGCCSCRHQTESLNSGGGSIKRFPFVLTNKQTLLSPTSTVRFTTVIMTYEIVSESPARPSESPTPLYCLFHLGRPWIQVTIVCRRFSRIVLVFNRRSRRSA